MKHNERYFMRINNINNTPYAMNHAPLKRSKQPSFKSEYEIDKKYGKH